MLRMVQVIVPGDASLTQCQVALVQSSKRQAWLTCLMHLSPLGHRGHMVWVGENVYSLNMDRPCSAWVPVRE